MYFCAKSTKRTINRSNQDMKNIPINLLKDMKLFPVLTSKLSFCIISINFSFIEIA